MTRRTLARSALLFLVAFAALTASLFLFPPDYANHGREAFAAGAWSDAVDYLRLAHRKAPDDADIAHLYASSLRATRAYDEARAIWEELRGSTDSADLATASIALSYADEGRFDDALRELPPPSAKKAKASLLEARGSVHRLRAEAALEEFRKFVRRSALRSTAEWAPRTLYEARGLSDEAFAKRLDDVLARIENREGVDDEAAFRAAFVPVREAFAAMARDYQEASASAPDTLDADFELLSYEIDRRDLDAARRHFEKIRALKPEALRDRTRRPTLEAKRARAVELLWRAFDRAGRREDALAILKDADDDRYREPLARLLFETGRAEEAATAARLVLEKEPRSAEANYVLGRLEKDPAVAADRLEIAHSVAPTEPTYAWEYGRALRAAGKASTALAIYMTALKRAPRDGRLNVEIAEVVAEVEGDETGRKWLEQRYANEFKSGSSVESAIVYERLSAWNAEGVATATTYEEALLEVAADPKNTVKIVNLARLALSERGDAKTALERTEEILRRNERRADAWIVKARALDRLGRGDEAFEAIRKARRFGPSEIEPYRFEAAAYLARGHYGSALKIASEGLERTPDDAALLLLAAEARLDGGAPKDAASLLERLKGDDATSRKALVLRGRTQVALGDAASAAATLRRALDAAPDDVEVRLALGEASLSADRALEGAAMLATIGGDPTIDATRRVAAGALLERAGRTDDAAEVFAAVLKSIKEPKVRADVAYRLMSCRAASSRPWTAIDAVYEIMADGPVGAPTFGALVSLLERSGAVAEASELSNFAKERGVVGPALHRAAFSAHLASGDAVSALAAADELRFVPDAQPGEAEARRAEALFALGRDAAALEAVETALKDAKGRLRAEALVVKLKLVARRSDEAATNATIAEIEASSPHAAARDAVIDALLSLGRTADAESKLSAAFGSSRTDSAIRAAALRAATGDVAGAGQALDAASNAYRVRCARGLIAAAGTPGPVQPRTYGDALSELAAGAFEKAAAAAERVDGEPESALGALRNVVAKAAAAPAEARVVARELALARLHHEAGVLLHLRDAAFRNAEDRLPSAADDLRVLKASWLVADGDGKAAAAIVVPMLERRGDDPATLYVAAAAAARNGGGAAAKKFFETASTAIPPLVARDVARLVARLGDGPSAVAILDSVVRPDDATRRDKLRLLVELRRLKEAQALAAKLPPETSPAPRDRATRAWIALHDQKTKAEAAATIDAVLKDARLLERFEGTLLLECAAIASNPVDFDRALEAAMRRAKFSAVELDAVATALKARSRDLPAIEALDRRLALLDGKRRIRDAAKRPIVYD